MERDALQHSPHLSLSAQLFKLNRTLGGFCCHRSTKDLTVPGRWDDVFSVPWPGLPGLPTQECSPALHSAPHFPAWWFQVLILHSSHLSPDFNILPDRDDNQGSRNLLITKQILNELGSALYKLDNFIDFGDWIFLCWSGFNELPSWIKWVVEISIYLSSRSWLVRCDIWDV